MPMPVAGVIGAVHREVEWKVFISYGVDS